MPAQAAGPGGEPRGAELAQPTPQARAVKQSRCCQARPRLDPPNPSRPRSAVSTTTSCHIVQHGSLSCAAEMAGRPGRKCDSLTRGPTAGSSQRQIESPCPWQPYPRIFVHMWTRLLGRRSWSSWKMQLVQIIARKQMKLYMAPGMNDLTGAVPLLV